MHFTKFNMNERQNADILTYKLMTPVTSTIILNETPVHPYTYKYINDALRLYM